MKKQLIAALFLILTQAAFAADLEYVGGNRYHCTGSNCAVFDSIQNSGTASPQPYRQSESARFAREYEPSEQTNAATKKISDDFFAKIYTEDTKAMYQKVEEIKAKQALDKLTEENNAIYAKGVEDGKKAAMRSDRKRKK